MAALKEHHSKIQEWGGEIYGVSVDTPEESLSLRKKLDLPFDLLSDQSREVITLLDILNAEERGGLAYPNIYILNEENEVIFHSSDKLATRTDPRAILEFIAKHAENPSHRKINSKRKLEGKSLGDLLLGYPRKFGWTKK